MHKVHWYVKREDSVRTACVAEIESSDPLDFRKKALSSVSDRYGMYDRFERLRSGGGAIECIEKYLAYLVAIRRDPHVAHKNTRAHEHYIRRDAQDFRDGINKTVITDR